MEVRSLVFRETHRDGWWMSTRAVLGATLGLAVAMGIGRFAYTPLLPVMQERLHFSAAMAGLFASFNYVGYLLGAMIAGLFPAASRDRYVYAGLIISSLTTGFMGLTQSYVLWSVLRGVGGVASAFVLVLSSSLMMDWLSTRGKGASISYIYSGPGLGMALTGILVPVFVGTDSWARGWGVLGIASLVLTACVRLMTRPVRQTGHQLPDSMPQPHATEVRTAAIHPDPPFPLWGITMAYGIEGLCYVVMATFVTVFFQHVPGAPWMSHASTFLVGFAAIPSTWFWMWCARRIGWRFATYAAFTIQAIGIVLPVVWWTVAAAVTSTLLFGGTFMGITTLALSIGRQCAPKQGNRVIGNMTAVFGVGQIIGPIAAGVLAGALHGYSMALLCSGLFLLVAVVLLWLSRRLKSTSPLIG